MKRNPFSVRRIILIFLLCIVSGSIMAQKINLDSLNFKQLNQYMVKATKMRNAGIIFTVSGPVIMVTSYIVGAAIADAPSDDPYHGWTGVAVVFYGCGVGLATTVVGIPLWVIGGIKNAKAEIALRKFDFKTNNSMAVGIGITIRF